jgi:hypothetical protein
MVTKKEYVRPHIRRDGTYVRGYIRTRNKKHIWEKYEVKKIYIGTPPIFPVQIGAEISKKEEE